MAILLNLVKSCNGEESFHTFFSPDILQTCLSEMLTVLSRYSHLELGNHFLNHLQANIRCSSNKVTLTSQNNRYTVKVSLSGKCPLIRGLVQGR